MRYVRQNFNGISKTNGVILLVIWGLIITTMYTLTIYSLINM